MITGVLSSAVGSGLAHDCGDEEGGRGEGAGGDGMGGSGTGEDMESFRGASLPRCLAMAEGGGFGVEGSREIDKVSSCAGMELLSSPDRSLLLSDPLSFSSFSVSSDFFQRGPKARFSLFGPVLWD